MSRNPAKKSSLDTVKAYLLFPFLMKPRDYQEKKQNLTECLFKACENEPVEGEQHGNLIKKSTLPHSCQPSCNWPCRIRHGADSDFRESISNMYAARVHMGVVYQGLKNCAFISQDLERCYIQTLCHIMECHPPHRDQNSHLRCKCPLQGVFMVCVPRGVCVLKEMGGESNCWRPVE